MTESVTNMERRLRAKSRQRNAYWQWQDALEGYWAGLPASKHTATLGLYAWLVSDTVVPNYFHQGYAHHGLGTGKAADSD